MSLRNQYNDSQLLAIRSVCESPLIFSNTIHKESSNSITANSDCSKLPDEQQKDSSDIPNNGASDAPRPFPLLLLQGPPGKVNPILLYWQTWYLNYIMIL